MSKVAFRLFAIVALLLFAQDSHANTTIGSASVAIMQNIALQEEQTLDFGHIALNNSAQGGAVTLTPDGQFSSSVASLLSGGLAQNAIFNATGTPNASVSLSFQSGYLTGAGSNMNIQNFTHDAGDTPTLNTSGVLTFHVGADLELNDHQASGNYQGTYQVIVNYQ